MFGRFRSPFVQLHHSSSPHVFVRRQRVLSSRLAGGPHCVVKRHSTSPSLLLLLAAIGICWALLLGCRSESSSHLDAAAAGSAMPNVILRDDTRDVMLTWADSAGDFHVVESVDHVPVESRERVRVVVTTQPARTTDLVYVADLRQKAADGSYPVSVVARSAWEEIGAARRKARLETLAPVASQLAPTASASAAPMAVVAVIYGAEWCGACREAERYLKRKGITVLEKDVDQSPAVQAELRAKLVKAGMPPTSSIPIIDIGGKLLVGFSQPAVDAALRGLPH